MKKTKERDTPIVKLVAAVVLLVLAIAIAVYSLSGRAEGGTGAYYYDLNTKKVFVGPAVAFAPIETSSGLHDGQPAGVRIFIFSCKPCRSLAGMTLDEVRAKGAFPVWLEKYDPESRELLASGDSRPEVMMEGLLMSAADNVKWISPAGKEATKLRDSVRDLCSGSQASACTP
jgi:hypothetical protein